VAIKFFISKSRESPNCLSIYKQIKIVVYCSIRLYGIFTGRQPPVSDRCHFWYIGNSRSRPYISSTNLNSYCYLLLEFQGHFVPFYALFPYWAHFRAPVSLFGFLLFVYSLIIRFHCSIYFEYKEPATSARCHVAEVSMTVSACLPITYIVYGSSNYFLQVAT
jgi:hypothetical protein